MNNKQELKEFPERIIGSFKSIMYLSLPVIYVIMAVVRQHIRALALLVKKHALVTSESLVANAPYHCST